MQEDDVLILERRAGADDDDGLRGEQQAARDVRQPEEDVGPQAAVWEEGAAPKLHDAAAEDREQQDEEDEG